MRFHRWVWRQPKKTIVLGVLFSIAFVAETTIALEAIVRARLGDEASRMPTRLYARPIVFSPGVEIGRDQLEDYLQRLGYRRDRRSRVGIGEYSLDSRQWVIGRRAFRHGDQLNRSGVIAARVDNRGRIRSVRDSEGQRLERVSLEPELLAITASTKADRVPVPLGEVPEYLIQAVLAIEDQRFFEHRGFDVRRIGGAAMANIRARRVVQGASTITQQLAKNLYLSPRRTPMRKLREAAMAVVLEQRYSKERILEAYLNQVYLAQNGAFAIHGVGRASQFFFGKDVTELEVSEAALLAGLIRGPSLYSPRRNPEAATRRRDLVLRQMFERGDLSEREYERAVKAPLRLQETPNHGRRGQYFANYVNSQLNREHGRGRMERGVTVFTTLDMGLQQVAERAVREGLARIAKNVPELARQDETLQAALVAINPQTGEVLAMVGGRDYGASQFNRAVYARRQPGSAFKPIVALAALSRDRGYTLATELKDEPLTVETPAGLWRPVNYDGQFRGRVTLRDALERSLNVPFARVGLDVGPKEIAKTARDLGIQSKLPPVPSLALGSAEVTPLELTRAFAVLAAGGFKPETHTTLAVVDAHGDVWSHYEPRGEQLYRPAEAYLVTSALRGAVDRGTGKGLRSYGYRGAVAAKSGTTNDYRDAWFVGYTPTLAVGVWVGFDDGRSVGVPGSRAAMPIFARFLVGALGTDDGSEFEFPSGLEVVDIDRETGLRGGPGCRGEPEVFVIGTAPEGSCAPFRYVARDYRRARRDSRWDRKVVALFEEFRRRVTRDRN